MEDIVTTNLQAMCKTYTVTIPAGGIKAFDTVYKFFSCTKANGSFEVRFSSSSGYVAFEQGLYFKYFKMLNYLLIKNPNNYPLIVSFTVGSGDFEDNRLTIVSEVQTKESPYDSFAIQSLLIAGGKVTVPVAKKIILQNNAANVMYIGGSGTDGLKLLPNGTYEYCLNVALEVWGTNGDTLTVGSFN